MSKKLNDFFDYLLWRGDLSFEASSFNDVDALILTQLSYIDFESIVQSSFDSIFLSTAAEKFKNSSNYNIRKNLGLLINPLTIDLLFECAKSERFGNIELCYYKSTHNSKTEEQFSAVTFLFDTIIDDRTEKSVFVAFRGTDDTIIGWKEDFNLALMEEVPAQKDALKYLDSVAKNFKSNPIYVSGHSKGGNLAIYSAANIKKKIYERINIVYNFDGPGFSKEDLNSPKFKNVEKITKSVYPQFSIIGMLFNHFENYNVAKSSGTLLMQHDPFTWGIIGKKFDTEKKLDRKSKSFYKTFNNWFEKLSPEKRKEFVETIFSVLEAPNAKNLNELSEHWHRNTLKILKAISDLDPELRKSTEDTFKKFIKEVFVESTLKLPMLT